LGLRTSAGRSYAVQVVPYVVPAAADNSQASGIRMVVPVMWACIVVGMEDHGSVEGVQHGWRWDEVGVVIEVRAVACAAEIVKRADVDMRASRKEVHIRDGEAPNICHRWGVN
jgi:hypothetical protein